MYMTAESQRWHAQRSVLRGAVASVKMAADGPRAPFSGAEPEAPGHPNWFLRCRNATTPLWRRHLPSRMAESHLPDTALAAVAALLYLVTRLWAIDSFPIFFYSDEANYVLFGEQALQHGLLGADSAWPALYFELETNRWTPGLSVYIHGLVAAAFGKSISTARTTSALISLGGMLALAWFLKEFFRSRFWWASILLGVSIPAWFLYSRTAFDTVVATSFYAAFLFTYMLYRFRSHRYLPLAAVVGAAAFYSYSNMQATMALLAACLLASDYRYHAFHRRVWWRSLPVLAFLALPFVEFLCLHPHAFADHLRAIGSYWFEGSSLPAALSQYGQRYLRGLSPVYWFVPQTGDANVLPNQSIPGAGHLGIVMLPLVSLGLCVTLRRLRSPAHRIVLLSLLVIPAGGAMDTVEIPRVLALIVPALILAVLGLDLLGSRLPGIRHTLQALFVAIALSALGLARLHAGVVHGPTWYSDYGSEGMQYGAKQIYAEAIPRLLRANPDALIIMSTTWANNTHVYPRFFLSAEQAARVTPGTVHGFLQQKLELDRQMIFGMTPREYREAIADPVIQDAEVLEIIPDPAGEPAFYFARLTYAEQADAIFRERAQARQKLIEETVDVEGQSVRVLHSVLGSGVIQHAFDGDFDTLVRGEGANPFVVDVLFPQPRDIPSVTITVGTMPDFTITTALVGSGPNGKTRYSQRYTDLGLDPTVKLDFGDAGKDVTELRIELMDNRAGPVALIHVRDIVLH